MRAIFFSIMMIFAFNIGCCDEDRLDDIKSFIQLLSETKEPTLSDYYRFYGKGAESELQLVFEKCRKKGWLPVEKNELCLDYVKNREADPNHTPSFYLTWLRTKLPLSPKISIHEVNRVIGDGNFESELITASLNGVKVVFFRTLRSDKITQFGLIGISKINSIPVSEMLEDDIEKGITETLYSNARKIEHK